jgi:hypothetical protein
MKFMVDKRDFITRLGDEREGTFTKQTLLLCRILSSIRNKIGNWYIYEILVAKCRYKVIQKHQLLVFIVLVTSTKYHVACGVKFTLLINIMLRVVCKGQY